VTASPASEFATALLGELISRGVRDVVLSPGSRSQALALAAAQYEKLGMLRLRVRIDERSAGFLAIGLAVETGLPVVVITTSGTAVAELHPAVLEAAHSGMPLVLLTADRPEELRGIGANQTTVQVGMFGAAAKVLDVAAPVAGADHGAEAAGLVDAILEGISGPVHVNVAFREPLSSAGGGFDTRPLRGRSSTTASSPLTLDVQLGTVVIAGTGAGADAEAAARALGAPLVAEVASGAHFGPNLVVAYRELLGDAGFGGRVERAIVFGHPTLSREIPALIERDGVETVVVRSPGLADYNPGHRVQTFADAVEVADDPSAVKNSRSWVGSWVVSSRKLLESEDPLGAALTDDYAERAAFARAQLAEQREPVTRRLLVEAVWRASWPHDRLVLGASRLIRELDRVAPGKRIPVHANRGLAGIDGTIATATGIALASQADDGAKPGITRVLLGDLALLHDAGSLLAGDGEPRPRMQVIVGNDGGGTIFDSLEVAATADPELIDRVLLTPQTVDLAALAAAYGWEYRRVETRGELDSALTPAPGRVLIEVPLTRV
jgi:2-succinyl-5-enolpyruvyl-6-hydroxy-3-cyclohexene-1-carboxylate synthase